MISTQKLDPETTPTGQVKFVQRVEDRLILACSSRDMQPDAISRVREYLALQLDWNYIVSQAQQHAVLPLINRNFQLYFSELVPKRALRFVNEASFICKRRSMEITGELLRIANMFEGPGIEAIPFKGPALAVLVYGDLSLRMFADLDILIHERDLPKARDVLMRAGYVPEFTLTEKQERIFRKTECALQLRHPGRDSVVELHWLLTERYLSIDLHIGDLWKRSIVTKIGQRAFKSLAPEDLFLYLCIHGSKHHWERLEWLCCVANLAAAHPNLDWTAVTDRARACGTERILNTALLLAHNLLGMPLPQILGEGALDDIAAVNLAEEAAVALFSGKHRSTAEKRVNRGDWYLYLIRIRERWRDKFRILAYSSVRLPHPFAKEFVRLPAKLSFLYYVLRPARLLGATVWAALHHARSGGNHVISAEQKISTEETVGGATTAPNGQRGRHSIEAWANAGKSRTE